MTRGELLIFAKNNEGDIKNSDFYERKDLDKLVDKIKNIIRVLELYLKEHPDNSSNVEIHASGFKSDIQVSKNLDRKFKGGEQTLYWFKQTKSGALTDLGNLIFDLSHDSEMT